MSFRQSPVMGGRASDANLLRLTSKSVHLLRCEVPSLRRLGLLGLLLAAIQVHAGGGAEPEREDEGHEPPAALLVCGAEVALLEGPARSRDASAALAVKRPPIPCPAPAVATPVEAVGRERPQQLLGESVR